MTAACHDKCKSVINFMPAMGLAGFKKGHSKSITQSSSESSFVLDSSWGAFTEWTSMGTGRLRLILGGLPVAIVLSEVNPVVCIRRIRRNVFLTVFTEGVFRNWDKTHLSSADKVSTKIGSSDIFPEFCLVTSIIASG